MKRRNGNDKKRNENDKNWGTRSRIKSSEVFKNKEVFENKKDIIMTQGQSLTPMQEFEMALEEDLRLRERNGFLKGIIQGIGVGEKRIAKNMLLNLKLDINTVRKATGVPKAELKKILADGHYYDNYGICLPSMMPLRKGNHSTA